MRARSGITFAVVLGMVVPFAPGAARAEPLAQPAPTDEVAAKQHYARGKQLVAAKDFARAYDEFSAGYAASHRAPFLFNMAECMRVVGNQARARELYTRYLEASPNGDLAAAARIHVTELGGVVPEPAPAPAPPSTPPAPPAPVLPPPQDVAAHIVEPAAAAWPPPMPELVVAHDAPRPFWRRPPFWIGVGIAVAGAAVGTYLVLHHHDSCSPPGCVELQ